jgi:hypothetical protein
VEIVAFDKGQRKDEVTRERLKTFCGSEGVLYIGKAQERFAIFRVIKKDQRAQRPALSLAYPQHGDVQPR